MGRAVAVLAAGAALLVVGIFLYVDACGVSAPAAARCLTGWSPVDGALATAAALGLVGAALGWWRFLAVLGTLLVAAGATFYGGGGAVAVAAGVFHLVAAWAAHRGDAEQPMGGFTRG